MSCGQLWRDVRPRGSCCQLLLSVYLNNPTKWFKSSHFNWLFAFLASVYRVYTIVHRLIKRFEMGTFISPISHYVLRFTIIKYSFVARQLYKLYLYHLYPLVLCEAWLVFLTVKMGIYTFKLVKVIFVFLNYICPHWGLQRWDRFNHITKTNMDFHMDYWQNFKTRSMITFKFLYWHLVYLFNTMVDPPSNSDSNRMPQVPSGLELTA
jgi:hypothetical protein